MIPAAVCFEGRPCPISLLPCPGDCVFADVMQSARHGVVVLDTESELLYFANQGAMAMLAEAKIPREYAAVLGAFLEPVPAAAEGDGPQPASGRFGDRLLGYSSYGSGRFRWVFFRDISEKVRLQSIAEAIELSNSFAHIFAAVRHEIGNPINSLKIALSVLRKNFDRFPREKALDYLDRSLAELGRVEELLASLRSLSFYDDLRLAPTVLDDWLEEFIDATRSGFHDRGIELVLVPGSGGERVRVDVRAMRQILANLLANSADAMSGCAEPQIRIETAGLEDLIEVRVVDNGRGIQQGTFGHMFKPFFTTKSHGTGLGLVIVRRLLARMQGLVEIDSVEGQGTTVRLTLPRVEA